ncbi:L-asparaginase [Adelges cooleyi]|uniref:L-asparaginase n=1 Tax=Adelges cooleyi TaxID=133065 RepID=UPI00217F8743|nr:L-asparaginase [Adelges cooleyi]XP_050434886.1 L-asparaginase [Adelges cooleyi]
MDPAQVLNGNGLVSPVLLRPDFKSRAAAKVNGNNNGYDNGYAESTMSFDSTSSGSNVFSAFSRNRCDSIALDDDKESKILVIYTGGTIGMIRNDDDVLVPTPNNLERKIKQDPRLYDAQYARKKYGPAMNSSPLVLPRVKGFRRIIYSIYQYNELLDSSNMCIKDWRQIAEDIWQAYELYDGFVVLHGTDTLAYTASALSFMFENLGKTVIITGAQLPVFDLRSDGNDNFVNSLLIAGNYNIPEVTIFFHNKLLRGNRTVKVDSENFDAFDSPNMPPLASVGIDINVSFRQIYRPKTIEKFTVHLSLNENVSLLRIFPNITADTVKTFLQPPIQGVVLQTYGAGNLPCNREDIMAALKAATDRGVMILNCSQCCKGSVNSVYQTGHILNQVGVISGNDITPEAALAKLSYVLSKDDWDLNTKRMMLGSNLRGEMCGGKSEQPNTLAEWDLVDAVARTLHVSSPQELTVLGAVLFPAMLNNAIVRSDLTKLDELKGFGADFSAQNSDGRTGLHLACSLGNLKVVRYLLLNGASVHIKDRFDRTPLIDAVENDHVDVIKLLRRCGAHLNSHPKHIGQQLCNAAAKGDVDRLVSYATAGADLAILSDINGRTALHTAVLMNQEHVVDYLIANEYAQVDMPDMLQVSPIEIARRTGSTDILEKLMKCYNQNN